MILGQTNPKVFLLQQYLYELNFYNGDFSGCLDIQTVEAIKKYQTNKFVTGQVTDALFKIIESDVLKKNSLRNVVNTIRKTLLIKKYKDSETYKHVDRTENPYIIIIESSNKNKKNPFHSFHYFISKSGEIFSVVDIDKGAIHSSGYFINLDPNSSKYDKIITNINNVSICLHLENQGELYYHNQSYFLDKEFKSLYIPVTDNSVINLNGQYYDAFTYEQLHATIKLIKTIKQFFNIEYVLFKNEVSSTDPYCVSPALTKEVLENEYKKSTNIVPVSTESST